MDSKFEKWGELPTEMRMECVKWMSFKSRMRLRGASKSDKSLVESAPKYHFDRVTIIFGNFQLTSAEFKKAGAEADNFKLEGSRNPKVRENAENLAVQLLKFASADNFKYIRENAEDMRFLEKIGYLESYKFKNVELISDTLVFMKMFAEKCENPEKMVIKKTSESERDEPLDQLIDIPAIHNAKILQLVVCAYSYPYKYVNSLIEKWGHRDAEQGTTLQLAVNDRYHLSKLSNNLKDRIIYKKANEIRLRAGNESKHILMRQDKMSDESVYISLVVIPADQKESEYEKNDQWAEELHEQQTKARQRRIMQTVSSLLGGLNVQNIQGMFADLAAPEGHDPAEDNNLEDYY